MIRLLIRRLVLLVVVLAAFAAGGAYWVWQAMDVPYRGFTEAELFVDVPVGARTADIAARLAAVGVVQDALVFRIAVRVANEDRRLQAGEYRFTDAATPKQVIARLVKGDSFMPSVTFPEGLTIAEMAGVFEKAGLGPATDFVYAADNLARLVSDLDPRTRNLEGYLFPSTYTISRKVGADGLVRAMVKEFRKAIGASGPPDGMTVRQWVTLASIVEKETGRPDERPRVASVYLNRLKIDMALQADPTVIYAMMLRHQWNGNIRKDDLDVDSPYNTYKYPGLPPGPIASPGKASLDAVRAPETSSYLYFVGKGDGSHAYASSLAEHNRNVREYQLRKR